jgi:hypothetical protein
MKWSLSTDFIVLAAGNTPKAALSEIVNSTRQWAVLEMSITKKERKTVRRKLRPNSATISEEIADLVKTLANPVDPSRRASRVRGLKVPGNYYFVLARERLLHYLDRFPHENRLSVGDVLALDKELANLILLPDGSQFHPGAAAPDGQFTKAIVLSADEPFGLYMPSSGPQRLELPHDQTKSLIQNVSPRLQQQIASLQTSGRLLQDVPAIDAPAILQMEKAVDVTMAARFADSLAVNQVAELKLSLEAGRQAGTGEREFVQLSPSGEVKATLDHSPNLRLLKGNHIRTMKVPTTTESSNESFLLEGVEPGAAWLAVYLHQWPGRGQVGYLELKREITPHSTSSVCLAHETAETYPPLLCEAPDLVLHIKEMESKSGEVEVYFRMTAGPRYPDPDRYVYDLGTRKLAVSANCFFKERFGKIENMPFMKTQTAQIDPQLLAAAKIDFHDWGKILWSELLPSEVQQDIKDHWSEITSIQIQTSGHHIPWEMVLLPGCQRNGKACPPEFLGSRYQVTRWIEKFRPTCSIRLHKLLYVAPRYEAGHQLLWAQDEARYLDGFPEPLRARVPATKADVVAAVQAGQFDVLHFVGHASQAAGNNDFSELELEPLVENVPGMEPGLGHRYPQSLIPENMTGLESVWTRRPLVFLNACQTGRQDAGLVRPGGWANAALGSRAGAFIGTLWSVRDTAAFLFSKTFYDNLRDGKTIGASALEARRAVANTGDPSWLAYVVYAHPNAKVVFETSPEAAGTPSG